MSPLSRLANIRRNLFARPRIERELDDELRAYLDQVAQEHCDAGMGSGRSPQNSPH